MREGDRLLFLLRHEFRLWDRSPQGLRSQWKSLLGWYALFWLVGCPVLWAQNNFQLPSIHFSASSPSQEAIWVAGGIVDYGLLLTLLVSIFAKKPATEAEQFKRWVFSCPLPSKILLTGEILCSIFTSSLAINGMAFLGSVPLALLSHSFRLFVGIHLTMTGWVIVSASLNAWSQYISTKYGEHKLWKLFRISCIYIASGVALFLFGLPYGIGGSFISAQQSVEMYATLTQRGHFFGSDSWIWIPGRTFFLDPLPTLCLIGGGFGLFWLTIQVLHRSYSRTLQPSTKALKKPKTFIKLIPFQSNLTRLLIVREWRYCRPASANLFVSMAILSSIPCIFVLPYMLWKIPLTGLSESLALGVCTGVWFAFMGSSPTSRVFGLEDSYMLLSSAPVSISYVGWCKRLAILIPIWASSFPMVLLTAITGRPWGWVALFVVTAPVCQVLLRSWNTVPIPSSYAWHGLPYSGQRDGGTGHDPQVLFWCEILSLCLWAAIPSLTFIGQTLWGLFALGLEVGLMAIAYRRTNKIGDIWSD